MQLRKKHSEEYVFSEMPPVRAVAYLVVPTVLTQIVSVIYNLADTFFLGKLGDPELVAAVGICLPPMVILTALANLFGVGASSAISRALGAQDRQRARLYAPFSFWCGVAVTLFYVAITTLLRSPFLSLIGADAHTAPYASTYLDWTLSFGGIFFFLTSLLAHFARTLGKSVTASVGVTSGAILNIVLDPLFIFGCGWGMAGAAIASAVGQMASIAILACALVRSKGNGVIHICFSKASFAWSVGKEVLQIGFVSFCMTALAQVSNLAINVLVSPYGANYLAASTVAIKLNIASFSIAQGMTVGVLPLLGYNYAAGNTRRVKAVLKTMVSFVVIVALAFALLSAAFPEAVIAFFIDDATTIDAGHMYVYAVALTMVPSALVFAATSYMQAIGQKKRPYILAFTRMGTVDVVCMIVCNAVFGAQGILFGKPIADWLCCITALFVLDNLRKHVNPFSAKEPPLKERHTP